MSLLWCLVFTPSHVPGVPAFTEFAEVWTACSSATGGQLVGCQLGLMIITVRNLTHTGLFAFSLCTVLLNSWKRISHVGYL